MIEPRSDMFPDKSEKKQEVEEPKTPVVKEDVKIEKEVEETSVESPKLDIPKGFVPYDALHAEREKRKEVEKRLKEFEKQEFSTANTSFEEFVSDEGKALKSQIDALNAKIALSERKESESRVFSLYPILLDKRDEFQEYIDENQGLSIDKVAKLFMLDNNLFGEVTPQRKGLEKPTGGTKRMPTTGYTEEDVKRLRETEPRKYIKLLRSGKLDPDNIGR